MPDNNNKTYKTEDGVFDIPQDQASSFLTDNPKAVEVKSFVAGKDTFDIPLHEVDAFLADNPHVTPMREKKNGGTTTSSPSSKSSPAPLDAANIKSAINAGTDGALDKPVDKAATTQATKPVYEDQPAGFDPHQANRDKEAQHPESFLQDYRQHSLSIGSDMKNLESLGYNLDVQAKDAEMAYKTPFQFAKTKSSLADVDNSYKKVDSIDKQLASVLDPEGKAGKGKEAEKYYADQYKKLSGEQKATVDYLQKQRGEAYDAFKAVYGDPVIQNNYKSYADRMEKLKGLQGEYQKSVNQYQSDLDYMTGNAGTAAQYGMVATTRMVPDPATGQMKEVTMAEDAKPLMLWDSQRTVGENLDAMKNQFFVGWGQGMSSAFKRMDALGQWIENAGTIDYDGKKHKLLGTRGGAFGELGKKMAGGVQELSKEAQGDPETVMTAVAKGTGGLAPMMTELAITPEVSLGKLVVPKLVTYMAYSNAADKFNERMDKLADKGFKSYDDLPEDVKWSLKKEGLADFAKGAGSGLILHGLNMGAIRYGAGPVQKALLSGTAFAGYQAVEDKIQGREMNANDLIASFLIGTALPATDLIKGKIPTREQTRKGLEDVYEDKRNQYAEVQLGVDEGKFGATELDAVKSLRDQAKKNLEDFDKGIPKGFDLGHIFDKYQVNKDIQGVKNLVEDGFQIKATPEELAEMKKIFTDNSELFYKAAVGKGPMSGDESAAYNAKAEEMFGKENMRLFDVVSKMTDRQRALLFAKLVYSGTDAKLNANFKVSLAEKIAHVLMGKSLKDIYGFNVNADGSNPERTFWASDRETVRGGLGVEGNPADWKENAEEARMGADQEADPTKAQDLRLRANFLENLGNIHRTAQAIANDPQTYIEQIKNDSSLTADQKDLFYKMIDDAVQHKGALSVQAKEIADKIAGYQAEMTSIDGAIGDETQKAGLRQHYEDKIEEATQELKGLYASQVPAAEIAKGMKPADAQIDDDELLSAWVKSDPELSREHDAIAQIENKELRQKAIEIFKDKATALMPEEFEQQFIEGKKGEISEDHVKEAEELSPDQAKEVDTAYDEWYNSLTPAEKLKEDKAYERAQKKKGLGLATEKDAEIQKPKAKADKVADTEVPEKKVVERTSAELANEKHAAEIDKSAKHVESMSDKELVDLMQDMVKNEEVYYEKFEDAQNIFNQVTDRIADSGANVNNPAEKVRKSVSKKVSDKGLNGENVHIVRPTPDKEPAKTPKANPKASHIKLNDIADNLLNLKEDEAQYKPEEYVPSAERVTRAQKLVSMYTSAGITSFNEIAEDIFAKAGDKFDKNAFTALKGAYAQYSTFAPEDIADELTTTKELRKLNHEDFLNQINDHEHDTELPVTERKDAPSVDDGVRQGTPERVSENEPATGISESDSGESGPSADKSGKGGKKTGRSTGGGKRNSSGAKSVGAGGNDASDGEADNIAVPEPVKPEDKNHVISASDELAPRGEVGKLQANIEAIKLVQKLEEEKRNPTPEEKKVLAKYTGWGGLAKYLDKYNTQGAKYYGQLEKLLTKDQLNDAIKSTISAHYTPKEVISALWDVAKQLGFSGGTVLESAAGIGHILGMMPEDLSGKANTVAYELDNITGRILRKLYPETETTITGFEHSTEAPNSIDLAITNVPFGKTAPHDKTNPELSKFSLHNYFIAKNLTLLKPGGIGVFITSSSSMDSAASSKFRKWVNNEGNTDFIGAIRLPNTAFKENAGTEVTADILLFRKRDSETPSSFSEPFQYTQPIREVEYMGEKTPIEVNEYFAAHPEQMLGKMVISAEDGGGMYRGNTQTLQPERGQDTPALLKQAVENLPKDAYGAYADEKRLRTEQKEDGDKEGTIKEKDGVIYEVSNNRLTPVSWANETIKAGSKSYKMGEVAKEYLGLKSSAKELLSLEQSPDATDEQIDAARVKLNEAYDSMKKKYGTFNRNPKLDFLQDDSEHNMVYALENIKKVPSVSTTGKVTNRYEITKADIFKARTNYPVQEPTTAKDPIDATNISISYRNSIDIPYVAQMLNLTPEEAKSQLLKQGVAFENPETGLLDDRDTYLSGFVRQKLDQARKAAKLDPKYMSNVTALEDVIPKDIPAPLIKYRLGSTWIPAHMVRDFVSQTLDIEAPIRYSEITRAWMVGDVQNERNAKNTTTFGTGRYTGDQLLNTALNLRQPEVFDYHWEDGKRVAVRNIEETAKAQAKMEELIDAFETYMAEKTEFHPELEKAYNEIYNSYVEKKYSLPPFTHFPGAATFYLDSAGNQQPLDLRIHQIKGVKRAMTDSTLFAHSVGTGKTFTMITTAMEWRRLGICKKPMIVVHNSTLDQFAASFKQLYPQAKLLVPTAKEMSASERQKLFNRIAYGDWDSIIIPQSFVDFIPDDPQREKDYIAEQIEDVKSAMQGMDGDKYGLREMEKLQAKLEEQFNEVGLKKPAGKKVKIKDEARAQLATEKVLDKQRDRRRDDVFTFENMGVDGLIVDEAHAYKKLGLLTKMNRVKGIDIGASKRAFGMYMKTRFIQEKNKGKGVVFATGTPITNTMAEIWTMMRYIAPDILEKYHMTSFDEFASTFGQIEDSLEFTASGQFKSVKRFKSYVNVPELIQAFRSKTDVVLTEDVPEFKESNSIPKLKTQPNGEKGFTSIVLPQSEQLERLMADFKATLVWWENLPPKEKKEKRHIPLVVFNRAKQAAIDPRLLDPNNEDDPQSKTNAVVKEILRKYKETASYNGAQLVISDMFQSPQYVVDYRKATRAEELMEDAPPRAAATKRFNLFEDMKAKLVAAGIPEEEIVIIPDDKEKRARYYPGINSGKYRVVFGTTERVAVGTNIQERLAALHHVDAPPRPMDFEQRNGRILRQGNIHADMNLPVEVITYGVAKTLDATAYGRLAIKQKFINQILKGDLGGERNPADPTEEDSAGDMSFDQMMANLSGSQYAIQQQHMQGQLRKLENAKRNHEQAVIRAHHELKNSQLILKALESRKPELDELYNLVNDKLDSSDKITDVEVDGKKYTETPSKPLQEAIDGLISKSEAKGSEQQKLVHINGVPVLLKTVEGVRKKGTDTTASYQSDVNLYHSNPQAAKIAGLEAFYTAKYEIPSKGYYEGRFGEDTSSGTGLISSFKATVTKIKDQHKGFPDRVAKAKNDIKVLEGEVKKPFGKGDQIEDMKAKLVDIEDKMKAEFAPPKAPEKTEEQELEESSIAYPTPEARAEHIDIAYGSEADMKSNIDAVVKEMNELPDFGKFTYTDTLGQEHDIKSRSIKDEIASVNAGDIVGRTITEPKDIAEAFAGVRNPLMEIAIMAYHDNTGKIVHVSAQTLGFPWAVRMQAPEQIAHTAKSMGATSVTLLHNHPSGNHAPSKADKNTTEYIAEGLKGTGIDLRGHVVIDHGKFTYIKPDGSTTDHSFVGSKDFHGKRYQLGQTGKPTDVDMSSIAQQLINEKGYDAAVVYLAANLKINGFEPIEPSHIVDGRLSPELAQKIEHSLFAQGASTYVLVHNGIGIKGDVPARALDVINTKTGETGLDHVDPAPGYKADTMMLFDTAEDYKKREEAREELKKAVEALDSASLVDRIKSADIVKALKGIVVSFHPFAFDKDGFARDAALIIRNRKGLENMQAAEAEHMFGRLLHFWNNTPKLERLGFILSFENPDKYGNAPDELKGLIDLYKERYDKLFDTISKWKDIGYIEDFFAHFWKDPTGVKEFFNTSGKRPFEGKKEFLKKRFYEDILKGIEAGFELASDNPEELTRLKEMNVWKFDTAQNTFLDLHKAGILKFFRHGQQPAGWSTVKDPIFERMMVFNVPVTDASGNTELKAKASRGAYYMPDEAAKIINNYLSIGLFNQPGTVGNVTRAVRSFNNIKNLFQLGFGFFHFTTTTLDTAIGGGANALSDISTLEPKNILRGITELAASASIVPYVASAVLRGHNAIKEYKIGNVSNTDVQSMVQVNANTGLSKIYSMDSVYNLRKSFDLLKTDKDFSQIPPLLWNAILFSPELTGIALMEWYVPRLKVGLFLKSWEAELRANPTMTEREKAVTKAKIWDSMDDRLGQVVYDNIFWNKAIKDLAFMTVRSQGWTIGTLKAVGKGVQDLPSSAAGVGRSVKGIFSDDVEGRKGISQRTGWLAFLMMFGGLWGGVMHYAMTGRRPKELKDYFYPETGQMENDGVTPQRVSLPTYMKDLVAYQKAPLTTFSHKTAPFLNELTELYQNKDFYGVNIYNEGDPAFQKGLDVMKYEGQSFIPFSWKKNTQEEAKFDKEFFLQKVGIMPAARYIERDEIQNEISTESAKINSGHVKTHEQAEQQLARTKLHEFVYNGGDIEKADTTLLNKAKIVNMDQFITQSQINPYERKFSHLPQETRENIFAKMTPVEKTQYAPYVLGKMEEQGRLDYYHSVLDELSDRREKADKIQQLRKQGIGPNSHEEKILLGN